MPFTIGGEWIPDPLPAKPTKPVKIYKEKRRGSEITCIKNLPYETKKINTLCSTLKKQLGCGGTVKEDVIELQGDQVEGVKHYLASIRKVWI